MEKANRDDIVLLFDYFNTGSQDLYASFVNAGYKVHAVVINDDGFLPDGVENVFEHFLGDFPAVDGKGKPCYFNQIQVPEFWQISGTNTSGAIHDKANERGRIFYAEPKNKRYVKVVDWLNEKGVARASDHYNKYGYPYARTLFNNKGQRVNKSYFDAEGKEIIVENFVTGDIILNYEGSTLFFKNRAEFVTYYIRKCGLEDKRLFFNSLSVPFFVSNALDIVDGKREDILFWQESTGDAIPGNMQLILDNKAPRCTRVVVQNHASFEKLKKLGAKTNKITELGFIYSFKKINEGRPEALICTNTENVAKLKEILEELPEVKFHVAALTEMSGKLLAHEKYDNAIMYPNIKMDLLDSLFYRCDFFLDINHEGEIVSATRKAFLHNQIILTFNETAHGLVYTSPDNRLGENEYKKLTKKLKDMLENSEQLNKNLENQRKFALCATPEDYDF